MKPAYHLTPNRCSDTYWQRQIAQSGFCACLNAWPLEHICQCHTVHSLYLTFGGRVRQLCNSSLTSLLSHSATHAVSFHASGEMPAAQRLQLKLFISVGWHQKANLFCLQMMRAAGVVWRSCACSFRAPQTTFLLPPCAQIPGLVARSPRSD